VSLNAISKHILALERAGLIVREVAGREHHCRLDSAPLRKASAWIEHYRKFWDIRLDALERHIMTRKKREKEDCIRQWMCPGTPNTARHGLISAWRSLRIAMKSAKEDCEHTGEYQTLEPPSKVSFTHEPIPSAKRVRQHKVGWSQIVDRLAEYFNSGKTAAGATPTTPAPGLQRRDNERGGRRRL
jgi:hypothetical protein